MRIRDALAAAHAGPVERLDAQRLLEHLLQRSRAWLLAHDDTALNPEQAESWKSLLERRAAGEPLAYLTGEREFHGLALRVNAAVLVPRPDTETLVDWGLELLAGELAARPTPAVADLGAGSGAIALAVKRACPRAQVFASDASEAALAVARDNGSTLGLHVQWRQGDWWAAHGSERFDLVLCNPPYIAAGDPHLPALRHEPMAALVPPGHDGLSALQCVAAGASGHLQHGAWLLFEHGHDQADAVATMLVQAGAAAIEHRHDLGGHRRCTGGRWP